MTERQEVIPIVAATNYVDENDLVQQQLAQAASHESVIDMQVCLQGQHPETLEQIQAEVSPAACKQG
eukprot:m.1652559 g.1652559  ORF g.1652559 m.1652559 type:complete len:67 (+) comp93612_c0_seq1:232-432(+)